MKIKALKFFLGVIVAIISPFIILAIFGILYIQFSAIGGIMISESIQSYMGLIMGLKPYFPYLTAIPIVMILLTLLIKRRAKIRSFLKR